MTEMGMENTTQQLHYHRRDDPTTQGQPAVPAQPVTELVSGRVPVATRPLPPAAGSEPAPPPPARPRESGRGLTTIAEDVVERVIQKVVDLTIEEVAGVHGLRPGVDAFFGFVDSAGTEGGDGADAAAGAKGTGVPERAVAVKLVDDRATINLSIEVEFGYAVHEVVEQVRASVIGSAERLLGITITEVNVVVADVTFDPDRAAGERTRT